MRLLFRFLKLFLGYTTLISLGVWSGVSWYILHQQPIIPPPAGYPANVAECRERWSQGLPYMEVKAEVLRQCDNYYAVLGDRDAPLLLRLKYRSVQRVADQVIDEFLASYTPQPGTTLSPQDVLNTVGSGRIMHILYEAIAQAGDPPTLRRKAQSRCLLDQSRMVRSYAELSELPIKCARR